jgi:hypothetical protein
MKTISWFVVGSLIVDDSHRQPAQRLGTHVSIPLAPHKPVEKRIIRRRWKRNKCKQQLFFYQKTKQLFASD